MEFYIKKEDLDYSIYCNIANFAKSRSINIIGGGYDGKESSYPISADAFKTKSETTKYVVILAEGVTFLQLCSNGDYHKKSKLLSLINKVNTPKIIIINHSNHKIKDITDADCEIVNGDRYLRYDWTKVSAEKDIHTRLIPIDEWNAGVLARNFLVAPDELPKFSVHCHESVWNGYKVGDIIEYSSPSISSNGMTSSIRLVSYEQ